MQKILSPNQFLFEQAILELLKEAKKHIRIAPFQTIEPEELVKSNNGILYFDLYHHYFIAAMTNQKTKQLSCTKYEKILRENLFDREHLPPQMISSILSACSSTGGSTTGSSHGSTNISTSSQQGQNLYVVNLIKTILLKTPQPSTQVQLALTYILQGTRNKRFNSFFSSILQEIYNNLLVKIRQEPIKRLVHLQINHVVNEIEYHLGIYDQDSSWMSNKLDQNGKRTMCIHDQRGGKGKFGRCYVCGKQADNYCKDEMVPICSFECKFRLKQIIDSENNQDHFNLMGWLIENLPSNDEIIYSFLGRQLVHYSLSLHEITSILKIIINIFTTCSSQRYSQHTATVNQNLPSTSGHYIFKQIEKHALNIYLHILFNYKHLYENQLAKYFKVFFFQIVRILELISIKRLKINQKNQKGSKGQLPASKESLQSSLNLSLDSMGNMQSLSSMAQNNPNVTSYLNYQQQFSNPFLNGIIQILSNQDLFFYIYSHFDCKFFQQNLLAKMMNIISQYAKQEIISKQYGFGITGSSAYGVFSILKMLTERLVGYEKHKNLRTFNLQKQNQQVKKFLQKYPINQKQVELKRNLPKIIELFNKKPVKGIIALKKLFAKSNINLLKDANEPLSESMIKQVKSVKQQSKQVIQEGIIQDEFEKNVQEIKKRAEKLQRQNLQASQLTIRQEDKNVSLDNFQESTIIEQSKQKSRNMEQATQDISICQSMVQEQMKQIQDSPQKSQGQQEKKLEQQSTIVVVQQIKSPQKQKQKQKQPHKKSQPAIQSLITSKQIAMFLRQNVDYASKLKKIPLLQKQKVAQYMGSTKDKQANQICYEFFKLDEEIYSKLQMDDCLRIQLNYFGTPKQGQQIEIVIDELSKVIMPHSYFKSSLHIYQYIYTLLMVNSGHNPNVKQSDKLKVDMFLSMVKHIEESKDRAQRDFHRIKKNELNNLYNWGELIFDHKYLMKITQQDWLFECLEKQNNKIQQQRQINKQILRQKSQQKIDTNQQNKIINVKWLMQYIWQYIYISIVNNQKKNSTLGVFQAIVLYGKYGLVGQQFGFVQIFKRSYQFTKSKQSLQSLLRLGIEFNNYLYQWSYLINLSYLLEQSNTYHEHIDKIFTNLQFVHKSKLKVFLIALCEFSTSEYKSDKGYNRQLFVLRHITQILQYNLDRLEQVWDQIWATIEVYFKGICLHPKRQIAMAAIDSYKQLSLKIFKIKSAQNINTNNINDNNNENKKIINQNIKSSSSSGIKHQKVLQTYLYIFQRSNIFIKDLIINILQNVVSNDIRSGWQIIYQILNINDSEDKTVVMKVVQRLVKQVGYKRLTSLQKLHQILIKQLRVNVQTPTLIQSILVRLWQVSQEIDQRQVWMQMMRSVKDIYKMSLNNRLLGFWFRIVNKCVGEERGEDEERKRRLSFQMMRPIKILGSKEEVKQGKQLKLKQQQNQQQREQQPIKSNKNIQINTKQQQQSKHEQQHILSSSQQISLDRQIYTQIVDWLIFLIDNQQNQTIDTRQSYILRIKQALQQFKAVKSWYLIRYLIGVSGLLSIFSMFIHSQFQTVFLLFLKQFISEKLLGQNMLLIKLSLNKYVQLITWLNIHFKQSIPSDLLQMKRLDEDFKKQRKQLIQIMSNSNSESNSSSPVLLPLNGSNQTHKIQLIEFSLSAQDFNLKSIANLILLDCMQLVIKKSTVKAFYQHLTEYKNNEQIHSPNHKQSSNREIQSISKQNIKVQSLTASKQSIKVQHSTTTISKSMIRTNFEKTLTLIYQNLIENYQISRKTNNLIALRNFLWNNGFLLYNTFKQNDTTNTNTQYKPTQQQQSSKPTTNQLIDMNKHSKAKSIPGLHKHQKRTLNIILKQLPEQDNYLLNIQILQDFINNYRLQNSLHQQKSTSNGIKKRKRQQSLSRGRKISQIIKNPGNNNNNNEVSDKQQSITKPNIQITTHQKQQDEQRERKQSSATTQKSKHIQVIQYEKRSLHGTNQQQNSRPKINMVQGGKLQKSVQNQIIVRELYLNDIQQWISSMQQNLCIGLRNLLRICQQAVQQKKQQNINNNRVSKLSSFLVNDQQMVKIFLLCLDLSGESECSLQIMRSSNTLMQTLLETVMGVNIEYGWKDQSEMEKLMEENIEENVEE